MTENELNGLRENRDKLDKRIREEERKIEYNNKLLEIKQYIGDEFWPDIFDSIIFKLPDGNCIIVKNDTILYSKILNCIKNLKEKD